MSKLSRSILRNLTWRLQKSKQRRCSGPGFRGFPAAPLSRPGVRRCSRCPQVSGVKVVKLWTSQRLKFWGEKWRPSWDPWRWGHRATVRIRTACTGSVMVSFMKAWHCTHVLVAWKKLCIPGRVIPQTLRALSLAYFQTGFKCFTKQWLLLLNRR